MDDFLQHAASLKGKFTNRACEQRFCKWIRNSPAQRRGILTMVLRLIKDSTEREGVALGVLELVVGY